MDDKRNNMKITKRQLRQLISEAVSEDIRNIDYRKKIQAFIDKVLNDQALFQKSINEYTYQIEYQASTNEEYGDARTLNLKDVYINCRDYGLEDNIKAEYFDEAFAGLDDMVGPYRDEMGNSFEDHDPDITDYSGFVSGQLADTGLTIDGPHEVPSKLSSDNSKKFKDEWARRAHKFNFQRQKEKEIGVDQMIDNLSTYLTNYTILQMNQQGLVSSDDMFLFKRIAGNIEKKNTGEIEVKK
jgi:hypothetical protein